MREGGVSKGVIKLSRLSDVERKLLLFSRGTVELIWVFRDVTGSYQGYQGSMELSGFPKVTGSYQGFSRVSQGFQGVIKDVIRVFKGVTRKVMVFKGFSEEVMIFECYKGSYHDFQGYHKVFQLFTEEVVMVFKNVTVEVVMFFESVAKEVIKVFQGVMKLSAFYKASYHGF